MMDPLGQYHSLVGLYQSQSSCMRVPSTRHLACCLSSASAHVQAKVRAYVELKQTWFIPSRNLPDIVVAGISLP